jgi:hypothetical protein
MSRITGTDAYNLMEAYQEVYAPQELTEEQVWEEVENWVNSLLEEGYDLSEYTWEEMYESYLSEDAAGAGAGARRLFGQARRAYGDVAGAFAQGFTGQKTTSSNPLARAYNAASRTASAPTRALGDFARGFVTGQGSSPKPKNYSTGSERQGPIVPDRLKQKPPTETPTAPAATTSTRTPTAPAATRPAAPKVAPTKPASSQTGDKAKDMATWAKANPKLAAAAAERERTRGTSSTTNPQMADMKSRLPAATPKVAPSNTLSSTVAAASKPAAFSPAPEVKATNTIAAAPKPAPVSPRQQRLNMEMEYDAYDVVLEYLLSEGHVETVEEAHYVMMEMDAETIGTIVEAAKDQSDKQIEKGVKATYKAGNVLDNTHQGRSPGLNKLPRGEREEKAQRMRGRLKARRDDLFGERNKREDAAREEMKKKYGL